MDAFYASVEQRENPSCAVQPVAVVGSRDELLAQFGLALDDQNIRHKGEPLVQPDRSGRGWLAAKSTIARWAAWSLDYSR